MNRASVVKVRTIGEGGTGLVEEAWLPGAAEPVALKRLSDWARQGSHREANLARFRREVRLLRDALDHPNIVKVLHAELEGDDPWFAMPLAPHSLEREVPAGGLAGDRVRELFPPILDAIAHAHGKGVVHRDLKPHNVLMLGEGPVVADFGLGRQFDSASRTVTTVGAAGGTLGYVAPEQWRDMHAADVRADVYALGSLLYLLVTGHDPASYNPRATPRDYRRLVERCREVDPARRFQSVEDLRRAFEELWETPPSPVGRAALLLPSLATRPEARRALVDLYLRNPVDIDLFRTTVGGWTEEALAKAAIDAPEDLAAVIERLNEHLPDTGFQFTYLDRLAQFLKHAYAATEELEVRHAVLTSIIRIGRRFDEIDLGEAFAFVAQRAVATPDALLVRDVLLDHPAEARWVAPYLPDPGVDRRILAALHHQAEHTRHRLKEVAEVPSGTGTKSSRPLLSPAPAGRFAADFEAMEDRNERSDPNRDFFDTARERQSRGEIPS